MLRRLARDAGIKTVPIICVIHRDSFNEKLQSGHEQCVECVVDEMPSPMQRIQTDRGTEFTSYKVQDRLLEWAIKFRPVRPASPHLNGKVARAQRTDLDEFYSLMDLSNPSNRNIEELDLKLAGWQHYNWERVHGSIGKPPIDKWFELMWKTPYYQKR